MFKRIVHPGSILKGELDELGITPGDFARQIDLPLNRVSRIISGRYSITGDIAPALWSLVRCQPGVLD